MLKKITLVLLGVLVIVLGAAYFIIIPSFPVGTGYAAKKMCSCYFIAERSQASIQKDDLSTFPINLTKSKIDETAKMVTSTLFGLGKQTAIYRENIGCILIQGKDDYNVQLALSKTEPNQALDFPLGENVTTTQVSGVDYIALQKAIDNVFDPSLNMDTIKTRAVVVIYKDTLIAEKYANGIDENTELLGWSMTKSITSALVGILVKDGKLDINQDHLFPHWTDDRSEITLNDMLQMQSGLAFEEKYDGLSDATEMLFMSEDIVKRATQNPLDTPPGTRWAYSSGTSNMISGIIRQQFDNHQDYLKFPHERLFQPLGMNSMVVETDEAGNYIGSSFAYATARDWAKFGLLYLNEGNWYGNQIIDTSWVDFTQVSCEHSNGWYGNHFWHNHDHSSFKDAPTDLYYASGFQGQQVFIIPSKDVVIVRMGLNQGIEYDANGFLRDVVAALK